MTTVRYSLIVKRAEPSRAEPSRAEPSRAEPSRAEPSRAEPSRAEPSRAEPSRAEPSSGHVGCRRPERRFRARPSLLPALALLLGALSLFAPAPAEAQNPPGAPSDLRVEAGNAQLVLKWTAGTGATGYDVHFTSDTTGTVANNLETTGSDPSVAWVAVNRTGTTPSQTISSLNNGTPYRVRVRSKNSNGASVWRFGVGTPAASSDASLKRGGVLSDALAVTSSTSATGTFTPVKLRHTGGPNFGGTVPNSHTHAKVTPTVNHSGATLKVGKQGTTLATVVSGSASGAIALDVGANVIEVVVTAEDRTTTLTYTVTITRQAAQPTDATLYRLTATSSTSAAGTFTSLDIGTFASGTTSYRATVPNSHTHAKLTPEVSNPNATVKVGKGTSLTAVTSGSASAAIPLVLGANAIKVEVTAADGTTKQTYTVTITRPSANANLSGLTASNSTSASGPFTSLNIGTFSATNTAYTATVAHSVTHVKLTPTVTHSSATVRVGKGTSLTAVTSGSASPAIALVPGANAIKAEVTAEDGTTKKTYTVTVTRQQESTATPAAPTELAVEAGNAQLALSWKAPSGTLTGYDVHYTSAAAGTVSNTAAASGSDASAAWVAVMRTGTTASQTISPLANNTDYRVRVRAKNSNGNSDWVFGAGTPAAPTAGVPAAPTGLRVSPGDRQLVLRWTAPSGTLTGYDLDYTTSDTVSSTAAASGSNPSVAWVAHTGTSAATTTETLVGLTNGARYRVRLRARNTAGAGAWAFGTGTPNLFVQWTSATYSVSENDISAHVFRLTEGGVSRAISGTVTYAVGATNGASLSDDLATGYATAFSAQANGFPTLRLATPVRDDVNEEHETFTVTIDPGTGYTVGTPATVTVTITDNDPPEAPSLSLTAGVGAGKLAASWTKPAGPVTGYQLRYKEASAASQTATTTGDPSTGWVTSPTQSTTTAEITGLTSGTAYHVQVRANDGQTGSGNGWSLWSASQSGTGPSNDVSLKRGGVLSDALAVTSSTSATGTFTPVKLRHTGGPNFGGTVANSHTHAKIIATVNHSGATVKVGKQGTTLATVASGSPSGAIALEVGANVIEVMVTSEDGTTTQTYTVTITRQQALAQSSNANLSGLTATTSTSSAGMFTALTLSPSTFSADTTSYTATVANARTHAKVTPTVAHGLATVTVGGTTVSSGSASGAIALSVGANAITVRVTAEDGTTTKDYTVTITRQAAAQSSNANLSALAATTSTSSTGMFTALTLSPSTFSATVTSYTATVANARTHAKVTPTVAHSSATVTVGGTTVTSGSASGAIALSEGSNAITVRVTAQDGTTTKDYTVTITRQAPNANLSGLAATTSTSSSGTFAALTLSPSTFSATTTSYAATVANGRTHAKVTPTVAHSSATVTVGGTTVSSGSASGAIALSVGANAITVRVTAEDGTTTKDYTVTITRQAPDAPPAVSLSVSPNPVTEGSPVTVTALLSKALSSAVTIPLTLTAGTAESGDYGALASITVASGATSGTGTVTTSQDADTADETFTVSLGSLPSSVTGGSPSTVTVRIRDDDGGGTTPTTPTVSLSASPNPVTEGSPVTVTARLSRALSNNVAIPLTLSSGTAESGDYGTLSSIAVSSGSTTGTGTVTTNQDADEDDETFTVALNTASLPSSVTGGSPSSVQITISDDDGGGTTPTPPTVSLSASPNPVAEGSPVTVTARLSRALSNNVAIPLTLSSGTAESGDYGTLSSITVSSGSTTGTGTVTTTQDADTTDETFTVSLGRLPSSVTAGSPGAVEVTITDDGYPPNRPPTVSASCDPCRIAPGGEVRVTAHASDPDGDSLTYWWSASRGGFAGPVNEAAARWRAPDETGRVTIRVRVFDLSDGLAEAVVSVEVANAPPAFGEPSYTFELRENEVGRERPVPLGAAVAGDPDGDEVTYALASGAGHLFAVGAGDGAVTYVGPGEDYETEPNRYELTVRARDPDGAEALAPVVVEVVNVNEPPVAAADTARTAEDEPVVIDVLANDTDPEGDALRVESVTAPSHGTARVAANGGVEYAPGADYHGPDRFTYTVADGNGGTATAEVVVVVEPVNDAPEAVADTAATAEDEPVLIDVLANDTDAEGDALRVESVTAPSHGTARVAANGGVEYAPGADYHGPDRFTYTVADGNGGTATAEVVVVVEPVNDAPEAVADTATTAEDEPVVIGVLANDTDAEGDALRIESVTRPAHGTARAAANGAVEYAPGADYYGPDRFTYTVADGNGGTAEAEVVVAVEPVNDAPEAVADTAATAEDEPVLIDVLANDTDVEDDALRVESVTAPSHGTARIAAGGGVEYAPEADYHGPDRFTYTVSDGNGGTAEAEVVVAVASVNDAPQAVGAIPDQALDEGGGSVALDLAPYFGDREGDPLAYTAVSSDPGVASVSVAGSALTLTPVGYGPASIEVTARDPGGLSAAQTFAVNASDRMVRAVLDETLAAMARAHLASARMTLGRRVGPGGADERSRLTVGGRSIPLDGAGVRTAAERLFAGWSALRHLRDTGLGEAERRLARFAADAADGRGTGGPPAPADLAAALGMNGLGGMGGLRATGGGTEFLFAWGGGEPGAQDAGGGGRWRFWGQGDLQTFAGDPVPERGYEGDLRTGWAGLDRAIGERWLAGVAVARSRGGGDWRADAAGGRLETSLTAVHPYLRWSNGATSVWTMAGGGRGSAENARATGRVGESDLGLGLGLVEVRRRLAASFGLRADAAWARLATGAGGESVDGRSAAVDQQRLGIVLAPSTHLGALALELSGEASARRDGGAGQTGAGLEVAGGFRAAGGPVRIDAQGRILVLHSAEGYEERGLGVTLSVGNPSDEEGLSFSVSPRWGGPAAASGALWEERLGGRGPPGPDADGPWSLDARGRYALRLTDGRLLAWSGGFSRSEGGWGLTIGGGLELAAVRD